MKTLILSVAALAAGMLVAGVARAEVLSISPSQASMMAADETGVSKAVFLFDLGGIESGEGRRIESAFLEWALAGTDPEVTLEFEATAVTGAWTVSQGVASPVSLAEEPAAYTDISPIDNERNGTGKLRLDVRELVAAWADGSLANHGVVMSTADLAGETLSGQIGNVRLTVRYGFVK